MNQVSLPPKIDVGLRVAIIFILGMAAMNTIHLLIGPEAVIWKYAGLMLFSLIVLLSTACWWILDVVIVTEAA